MDEEKIKRVYDYWDLRKELPVELEAWWKSLSSAERREIRHTYEFEEDE